MRESRIGSDPSAFRVDETPRILTDQELFEDLILKRDIDIDAAQHFVFGKPEQAPLEGEAVDEEGEK